jgi:glycosyltransferase involved in cell wall biosynthesis
LTAENDSKAVGGSEVHASVSVVIPTYRRDDTLPRAVRSALMQGPVVCEVIVVDDNREERHSAKVRRIIEEANDSRVVYLQNDGKNGGAASRNVGIRRARGSLVAFLDDDDYWLPGKITAQRALMEPGIVGVDCGYVERDDAWGLRFEVLGDGKTRSQAEMLAGYCPVSTSLVMVVREVALRVGMFDEDMTSFEDYDLWLRCASAGRFATLRQPRCVYVQHSGFRLSVALEGRLLGLERFIERWRPQLGSDADVDAFRRRWRLIAYATNARRALASSRVEALRYALTALRLAPRRRIGWQALAFAAMGFRSARGLSRARHARAGLLSNETLESMRLLEEPAHGAGTIA